MKARGGRPNPRQTGDDLLSIVLWEDSGQITQGKGKEISGAESRRWNVGRCWIVCEARAKTQKKGNVVCKTRGPAVVDLAKICDYKGSCPRLTVSSRRHMKTIGDYEILEVIEKGGMGRVYTARHSMLHRVDAIKELIPELEHDAEALKRFKDEARQLAQLDHENVVIIHNFVEQDGRYYLVMEYLEGMNLRTLMQQNERRPLSRKLHIAIQICKGLQHSHLRGIVHRDIKPENIQIRDDGRVKIIDFGIARSSSSTITQAGVLIGTRPYMSPEQARGEYVDHRSDIFSFGIVLYELLTSRHPFEGKDVPAVLYKITHEEPPPLTLKEVEGQDELRRIIRTCLEKEPEKRYNDFGEVIDAFEDIIDALSQVIDEGDRLLTLRDKLSRVGALSWRHALRYVEHMLAALNHTGGKGVVHGGIRPANILLTKQDKAQLFDPGREQAGAWNKTIIKEEQRLLCYRAPEHFLDPMEVDQRSDLYALGVVLYEMLTGRLPFDAEADRPVLIARITAGEAPPPDHFVPELPPEVVAIVMRVLEPDPNKRYQRASEMRAAIKALTRTPWGRRVAAVATFLVLVVGSWFFLPLKSQTVSSPGILSVSTTPEEAQVFLDSLFLGQTPLDNHALADTADTLIFRIEKEGYVALDTTVYRQDERSIELNLVLDSLSSQPPELAEGNGREDDASDDDEPLSPVVVPDTSESGPDPPAAEFGTVVLTAKPAGVATLFIDNKPHGTDSVSLSLSAGAHEVSCSHPDYDSIAKQITVIAGQTDTVTCYFEHPLSIVTELEHGGASFGFVVISGQDSVEQTPVFRSLKPGTYIIGVERDGYTVLTPPKTLRVQPGFSKIPYRLSFKIRPEQ